ncbi:MAG: hypothetical protein HY985_17815 [Magnetospirillum sp.]|nr:hypothetical protein [Magnetospirillum sp.]
MKAATYLRATVHEPNGTTWPLVTNGRLAWALGNLIQAGDEGCTPLDNPGPRWSAYVHKLRREFGLDIETIDERHEGPYPGTHARYVLRSRVELIRAA